LVHHADRGSPDVSIRHAERLAEAGIEPSLAASRQCGQRSRRDVTGLFRTEVIRQRSPRRSLDAVEFATLEWVD
jgi:hypothetical protein